MDKPRQTKQQNQKSTHLKKRVDLQKLLPTTLLFASPNPKNILNFIVLSPLSLSFSTEAMAVQQISNGDQVKQDPHSQMGKGGEEQSIPVILDAERTDPDAENRCRACKLFRFRCVFVLFLGIGVFLSALFWLPPFLRNGDGGGDLDLNSQFRGGFCFFCYLNLVSGYRHCVIEVDLYLYCVGIYLHFESGV